MCAGRRVGREHELRTRRLCGLLADLEVKVHVALHDGHALCGVIADTDVAVHVRHIALHDQADLRADIHAVIDGDLQFVGCGVGRVLDLVTAGTGRGRDLGSIGVHHRPQPDLFRLVAKHLELAFVERRTRADTLAFRCTELDEIGALFLALVDHGDEFFIGRRLVAVDPLQRRQHARARETLVADRVAQRSLRHLADGLHRGKTGKQSVPRRARNTEGGLQRWLLLGRDSPFLGEVRAQVDVCIDPTRQYSVSAQVDDRAIFRRVQRGNPAVRHADAGVLQFRAVAVERVRRQNHNRAGGRRRCGYRFDVLRKSADRDEAKNE